MKVKFYKFPPEVTDKEIESKINAFLTEIYKEVPEDYETEKANQNEYYTVSISCSVDKIQIFQLGINLAVLVTYTVYTKFNYNDYH